MRENFPDAVYIVLVALSAYLLGSLFSWALDWHSMSPAAACMSTALGAAATRVGIYRGIRLAERRPRR